ncbi:rod shape-determining protein MreD [Streptacidiphilus fuscans]|uniref:Rod shape-determining protein MreD n=1 Tax=Streptacidiphilus fuscans TaxID=2789292 RepID=A0A931BBG8_9ACTN|nr:rod shape-determining protein MreD [Streptacidiphilus fuscans]MBF9070365.1 rod shape-determining protein MreD [Streptacidiphilus fuscans]
MWFQRALLSAALVVLAVVVQVSILARLGLPGAVPDLLLLVVIGLALVYGHVTGCLVGFFAGLFADLAPPSDHAVGRYALVLCLVGYIAGLMRPETGHLRSVTRPLAIVAVAAFGATLLYAGVGALVGDTAARHVGLTGLLVSSVIYDVLLAPFVVPAVMALARRTVSDPAADGQSRGGTPKPRRIGVNRRGTFFGDRGTRTGGAAGLGTVPGFGNPSSKSAKSGSGSRFGRTAKSGAK